MIKNQSNVMLWAILGTVITVSTASAQRWKYHNPKIHQPGETIDLGRGYFPPKVVVVPVSEQQTSEPIPVPAEPRRPVTVVMENPKAEPADLTVVVASEKQEKPAIEQQPQIPPEALHDAYPELHEPQKSWWSRITSFFAGLDKQTPLDSVSNVVVTVPEPAPAAAATGAVPAEPVHTNDSGKNEMLEKQGPQTQTGVHEKTDMLSDTVMSIKERITGFFEWVHKTFFTPARLVQSPSGDRGHGGKGGSTGSSSKGASKGGRTGGRSGHSANPSHSGPGGSNGGPSGHGGGCGAVQTKRIDGLIALSLRSRKGRFHC